MLNLSFNQKRFGALALLGLVLFCMVNLLFDLDVFGKFDEEALAFTIVSSLIYVYVVGPSQREVEEYRERARRGKSKRF